MRGWVTSAILAAAIGLAGAPATARAYVDTDDPLDPFGRGYSPPAKPAPKSVGYLLVYSTPWARIFVDGKDTGKTTPISSRSRLALAPGKHKVMFVVTTDAGEERYTYTITIRAGETTKITKQLPVTAPAAARTP